MVVYADVKINASELSQRIDDMTALSRKVSGYGAKDRTNFRLTVIVKPFKWENLEWGKENS